MKENGLDTIRKDMDFLEKQWVHKKGIFKNTSNTILTKELLKAKKNLEALKRENPEAFEQYYWETYVCVERDKVCGAAKTGIVSVGVVLLISIMDLTFSILDAITENILYKAKIGGIMLIGVLGGTVAAAVYLQSIWNVRERSYYKILLTVLEDVKNAETEGDPVCIVQNAEVK